LPIEARGSVIALVLVVSTAVFTGSLLSVVSVIRPELSICIIEVVSETVVEVDSDVSLLLHANNTDENRNDTAIVFSESVGRCFMTGDFDFIYRFTKYMPLSFPGV